MAERGRKSTEIYRLAPDRSSFHTTWVKLRRIGFAAALLVNLQQRKCLRTGRHSGYVPIVLQKSVEGRREA